MDHARTRSEKEALGRLEWRIHKVVSVIIRAAHVVAALFTEELALALRQPGRADRAPDHRLLVLPAHGRRFGFAAGVGLDAEAVRRLDAYGRTQEHGRASNVRFVWEVAQLITEHRGRFEPALEVLGRGRAAFAFVANCDPYTYAGRIPIRAAPEAQFELGLDLVAPRTVSPASIPRLLTYALRGRGQATAGDVLYAHDVDRIEIVCDQPMPLQVDGEDIGDATSALFEAERDAVLVLN